MKLPLAPGSLHRLAQRGCGRRDTLCRCGSFSGAALYMISVACQSSMVLQQLLLLRL